MTPRTLLRRSEHVLPLQARSFIALPFTMPAGVQTLHIAFSFAPAAVGTCRNLLTLSLFDPRGFRGAAHRHAPQQEIVINHSGATPGFLPGPLDAGAWLLEIDCHCILESPIGGIDYTLDVSVLSEALGPNLAMAGRPGPLPAKPPEAGCSPSGTPRWLKGDLHIHSNHSDGRWTVDDLVRYAQEHHLDFLAVTDHNTISPTEELVRTVRRAGTDLVLIPGMELTTFYGHANALGLAEWIDWRVASPHCRPSTVLPGAVTRYGPAPEHTMERAAAEVHRLGGTLVINHPRSMGYPQCTGCRWELGDASLDYADAVELWNGVWGPRRQNVEALELWTSWLNAGYRIPITAGTDGHTPPRRPDLLASTHVWAAPRGRAILDAVRAGRSYLSSGPALIWTHPGPGQSLTAGDRLAIVVGSLFSQADLHLVHNGQTVARRTVAADGPVTFDLQQTTAGRSWYRAELYRCGSAELLAITNPVYVDLLPS